MKTIKLVSFSLFVLFTSTKLCAQKNHKPLIESIIEHYFDAIGGKEKAAQIKTFSSVSTSNLGGKEIVLTKKMMLPNLFYTSMELDGYQVSKNTFDGKKGVSMQQDVENKFSSVELKRHKKNRSIFPEFDYIKTAKYIGIEKVNNEDCHVLQIENVKVYYAIESGLKVKGVSIQEKDGVSFAQELYFSKHIEIEGLLLTMYDSRLRLSNQQLLW